MPVPPVNPFPNVGSQIERALRQYFINGFLGATALPQPTLNNGGIFLTLDNGSRSNPLRTIMAQTSKEMVEYVGAEIYQVTIVDQFEAIAVPGQVDPDYNRVQIDLQLGQMQYLMMLTANNATLDQTCANITNAGRGMAVLKANGGSAPNLQSANDNADMAQFTCLLVVPKGSRRGKSADEDEPSGPKTYWREVRMFEITAAPSFIPGYPIDPTNFPIAVDNNALTPLMASNGTIAALPFYDRVTGNLVYLSLKDWDVDISDSPN